MFYVKRHVRLDHRFIQVKCNECIGLKEIVTFDKATRYWSDAQQLQLPMNSI